MRLDKKLLGKALLAGILLVCVLAIVFQSRRSTSALSITLSGTWASLTQPDEKMLMVCAEGPADRWQCSCDMTFHGVTRQLPIHALPLFEGGWYWRDAGEGAFLSLHMSKGKLLLQQSNELGKVDSFTFSRPVSILDDNMGTIMRKKSKYVAALIMLIGSYKFVFAKRRLPREARLTALRRQQADRRRAAALQASAAVKSKT